MAQIKIEITYDPSTETLEQAVGSLVPKAPIATLETATADKAEVEPSGKAETVSGAKSETSAADKSETAGPAATTGGKTEGASKTVSKTDVRAVATALSKAGKREALSAIFAKFGGKKLSDIKEEDYPALMEKLEAANG